MCRAAAATAGWEAICALAIDPNSRVAYLALVQMYLMNENMELIDVQMKMVHDTSTEGDN